MYRKRIAVDLAKDVFQVAEAERSGAVSARKRLSRVAFVRYIQAQTEPSLFIMEACGTAHYWARFVQTLGHHCVSSALKRLVLWSCFSSKLPC